MSRNQRLGLIALTAVVAVVAFVLLRPTDSDNDSDKAKQPAQSVAKTETTPKTTTQEAKPKPEPEVATVRIENGKPAGGTKKIAFQTGETGRINVTSNGPGEVHLHGYDIEKPVAAGKTTKIRFKADIEGVFEFEDHDSGEQLASVEVSPQ